MKIELNLRFPEVDRVIVSFDGDETQALEFISPITQADRDDIRWYLETYAASYATDVDDDRAKRIAQKLPQWGEALFDAVFRHRAAQRLCDDFLDEDEPGKLLTIAARHPEILALPWELLRDSEGTYLLHDNPRISIRRKLAGAGGGRRSFRVKAKERLRLLYVVSRPSDAGFIDPRAESRGVLEAIELEAAGRVDVEFLRPATLDKLTERLEDDRLPRVDIVHFDGHGAFDPDGRMHDRAKHSDPDGAMKTGDGSNVGYLLFEDDAGKSALITAETLADMLNRKKIGAIVLSACQSAKVAGEEAMGSVAARLTHAGIPTVLAMTHSVLVVTARQLFARFYRELMRGKATGEALDSARRDLYLNRERGERRRGDTRIILKLDDWFLPALYQTGKDVPLLQAHSLASDSKAPLPKGGWGDLPEPQEAGFFGRSRELWQIDRAFSPKPNPRQETRRMTISGFGGQGKTELALEAGRWLCRTGLFRRACFVDFDKTGPIHDPVGYAVSTLGTVANESLIDANAATEVLRREPTLLILDNLEILEAEPLRALLDAAKIWSEAGNSRVLLTTRAANFHHPDYPTEGSYRHLALPLAGLGQTDALAYFQSLMQLPPAPKFDLPKREALLELFELVGFHPLSIKLLARQLKDRRIAEVGQALERLLADTSEGDKDRSLVASLNLSLERLDTQSRQWLPRLGVFQGGAMEDDLLAIAELEEGQWQILRQGLEATGLIQVEPLPGVNFPYIKFHPTLAPVLWKQLSAEEREALQQRHRQRYYLVSAYLYFEDAKNPHAVRAIVLQELPNLMFAVRGALVAEESDAVDFVEKVNRFLDLFGLHSDSKDLCERAAKLGEEVGSDTWFLALRNYGKQLCSAWRYEKATRVFEEILVGLGDTPSYNRCLTLTLLGECLGFQGKSTEAVTLYHRGLAEIERLEPTDGIKQQKGMIQVNLANALRILGDYDRARQAYEAALVIQRELGDVRGEAIVQGQLGYLALEQNNLSEAEQHYQDVLTACGQLNEPATEATAWHQLGRVYRDTQEWEAAERAYREAARIRESLGNLVGAATTWGQLGIVNRLAGQLEAAEAWYWKAMEVFQKEGARIHEITTLNNLTNLLQTQPHRLPEARQLAEEALVIKETLDPAAAEIWKTYELLAQIAQKQNESNTASHYRRLSQEARAAFAGTQYELRQYAPLIAEVVAAVEDAQVRQQVEAEMEGFGDGWKNLVAAIRQIWAGERDEAVLCDPLDYKEAPILSAILRGIADPTWLRGWLDSES